MPTYNQIPAVDENFNLPPEVRAAFSSSSDLQAAIASKIASDPNVLAAAANVAQSTAGLIPVWKANTAYTANQKVIAPDGAIVSAKTTFTSGSTYDSTNWVISEQFHNKGLLPDGTDFNNLKNLSDVGEWYVATATNLATMANAPSGATAPFIISIRRGPIGYSYTKQIVWSMGISTATYERSMSSGTTWNPWTQPSWIKATLSANTDIDALVDGIHKVASSSVSTTFVNVPALPSYAAVAGTLEKVTVGNNKSLVWTTTNSPFGMFVLLLTHNGTAWANEWRLISTNIPPSETAYTTLDAMSEGTHRITSTPKVTQLGLPENRSGIVTIVDPRTDTRTAKFETIDGNIYYNRRVNNIWGSWVLIVNAKASAMSTPSGWKTVPLALTSSRATLNAPLMGTWRLPLLWAIPSRRFRVRISLRNGRYDGLVQGGGVTLNKVYFGDQGTGNTFKSAPFKIAENVNIPDNGDAWISSWIDLPVGDNVPRMFSFTYTATTAPTYMVSYGYEHVGVDVAADLAPSGGTIKSAVPLDIHFETEIPTTVPIVAVVGDSKSNGTGTSRSLIDSTISQWARANVAAPMHLSSSGDTLANFALGTWKLNRWDGVTARPDHVILELGINDLISGNAAQMAVDRATIIGKIQQYLSNDISLVTIAVNEAHNSSQLAERKAYNNALRTALPSTVTRLFDFDSVISLSDTQIRDEYDFDGLHLNVAGYAAEASILRSVVGTAFSNLSEVPGFVAKWRPSTMYALNQWAISPRGNLMICTTPHTSTTTFSTANEANWAILNPSSRGWLPTGADLNTFIDAGTWVIPNQATADSIVNWPAGLTRAPGIFVVEGDYRFGSTIVFMQTLWTYGSNNPGKRERSKLSGATGAWNNWIDPYAMTDISGAMTSDYAMSNMALRDAFIRRRGGSLGSNGVAVLALRWDHGAVPFRDKLLPKLLEKNLPSSFVINPSAYRLGLAENLGVTWDDYNYWAKHYGIEFVDHGMDHLDAADTAALKVQILDSKDLLQTNIPTQSIDLYSPPGVTGTGLLDPWVGTSSPDYFTAKWEPARYVLESHAFSSGYGPGLYRDLDGNPSNGETHWTMDNETSSAAMITRIQTAQSLGSGIQLMLHPSQVDLTGKITLATFNEIMDFIAAERDAGRLIVTTMGGLFMANSRSSFRHNMLRNPSFNGTIGWNSTGYTLSEGVAQSNTSAGLLSQTIDLTNRAFFAGAHREITAKFTADASGAVVRLRLVHTAAGIDVDKQITLAANETKTLRIHALMPIWSGSNLPVFYAGRVSGGAVKVEDVGVLAV
ncbi:hypothetical protein MUDCAT_19 [Arthrobacter phage Mudcat]|uniref:SGNH hydrolase-type esterase domain-containing protein n=1 Tax=Arthrobacter phage Mudcat TaxID=1796997 RepID=A0A140G6V2_9CAUD|nr:tail protein [Arthrobacter phage Mudcat]AMM44387.1 hypothetical protein MUDCAT_19 [Arthrobacter phage Mudcat]